MNTVPSNAARRAEFIRAELPPEGLFAGHVWRIMLTPFSLGAEVAAEIESLGRVFLQFYRAVNQLYRRSVAGQEPAWVSAWLDQGKPTGLIELQRAGSLKNELPGVIRPDLLLTESGLALAELDSVPGGIGITAWLNQTYARLPTIERGALTDQANGSPASDGPTNKSSGEGTGPTECLEFQGDPVGPVPLRGEQDVLQRPANAPASAASSVLGGADGMFTGFAGLFGDAPRVHIVVSEEAATYRPEMEWLCGQLDPTRFKVRSSTFTDFTPGDAVYRFFELFDVPQVANAQVIFAWAREKRIRLTPPPKPIFEEKLLFALLWNRNLRAFWRQELGERFFQRLQKLVPYTWLLDPTPLPPHAAIPELNLTDWQELKSLSQQDRQLILKVSGFSEKAWGARSVFLGSDLSLADWSAAIDDALRNFGQSPYVLQRYHKPKRVSVHWYDYLRHELVPLPGRVRLCPYYFVAGAGDAARAHLGGVLATICPADKKIIHGMTEAVLAPCTA